MPGAGTAAGGRRTWTSAAIAVAVAVWMTTAGLGGAVTASGGIPADPGATDPLREVLDRRIAAAEAAGDADMADRLELQASQADLVHALDQAAGEDEGHTTPGLAAARVALQHRAGLGPAWLPDGVAPGLAQEERNLDLVEGLLALRRQAATEGGTAEVFALATRHQAAARDIDALPETPRPAAATPGEAVRELLAAHGHAIPAGDPANLAALDDLPAPVARDLTRTVAAFTILEAATADARTGDVLAARLALVEAAMDLRSAVRSTPPAELAGAEDIHVPPVLSIDLDPDEDNTYDDDVALLIDAGGNDTYHNNAGGNGFDTLGDPCDTAAVHAAAALFDLGTGDDTYGNASAPRSCGANGGADVAGTGLLYDEGGNDTYVAGEIATNGGGNQAFGALIDEGGNDLYQAGNFSANGGGRRGTGLLLDRDAGDDRYLADHGPANGGGGEEGGGLLVDEGGSDRYTAGDLGTNGGASAGVGALVDLGTDRDVYTAGEEGTNGGGNTVLVSAADDKGAGFLYDEGGDDVYAVSDEGSNGGGEFGGVGMLVDEAGDDDYLGDEEGSNGGASAGSAGFLVDGAGDDRYIGDDEGANGGADNSLGFVYDRGGGSDTYIADRRGANGGGVGITGVGFLYDDGGDDTYRASEEGTNGGSAGGAGFLYDAGGDDRYNATSTGTNGGGAQNADAGLLYDGSGNDTYVAGGTGVNGGADLAAAGLLYDDGSGTDRYEAARSGVNGGATTGIGALYDAGGIGDTYLDFDTDCTDCTIVPKGTVGAQVDHG